jgi:hypothetical protein
MQSADLFQEDIVQSERNDLKVTISYVKLKAETARQKEVGFVAAIINLPSRYLVQGTEARAIEGALNVLGEYTGFYIDANGNNGRKAAGRRKDLTANVVRKTFALETTFLIKNQKNNTIRSWVGSMNAKNNRYQRVGVLDNFQPLTSKAQLVNTVRSWSDGRAIETKIKSHELLENVTTDWKFLATVSLCIVINLRGYFPPALRPKARKGYAQLEENHRRQRDGRAPFITAVVRHTRPEKVGCRYSGRDDCRGRLRNCAQRGHAKVRPRPCGRFHARRALF